MRKRLLQSKKTERIISAATPELKAELKIVAKEKRVSVSALITQAVVSGLMGEKELPRKGQTAWRHAKDLTVI